MRPKTPKTVRRCTNGKGHHTSNNLVARSIVHILPRDSPPGDWARTGARRRKSFPCSHRSLPVVDQRNLSDLVLRHFSQQNNRVCDCCSHRKQRCCLYPLKQNITSLFLSFNLQGRPGSCPSVSRYKSLQRVICVFEVGNNRHTNSAERHEPRSICHCFDQFS